MTIAFAVAGTGRMARVRTAALLATGRAALAGVASRTLAHAEAFAAEFGCAFAVDDYRKLDAQAILVEVPHRVQSGIVRWALEANRHVLIGGSFAMSREEGEWIASAAESRGVVVEAGYEARYKPVWEHAREQILSGSLGRIVAVDAVALWPGDPASWYYDEAESGGMPLSHLTYTFVNPVRWILGDPVALSAFANRIRVATPSSVREETCTVNFLFPDDVIANMLAGYVRGGDPDAFHVNVYGTDASLRIDPADTAPGSLTRFDGAGAHVTTFGDAPDAFVLQAHAFCDSIEGKPSCRNGPRAALVDVVIAEAVSRSAGTHAVVPLASVVA